MSNKNYRTINGLYKALLPAIKHFGADYEIIKNDEDVTIFSATETDGMICGTDIEYLMPILKRCCWMIRRNTLEQRIELVVWNVDDTI